MNYPQAYLDAPIQTNSEDFPIELLFYKNTDVINGKIEKPEGFIDPFGDPDSWRKYRESCDMKPKHWKSYIELNIPWLDPKKELKDMKAFRGEKDELERMTRCGCKQVETNPTNGKLEVVRVFMCRCAGCPNCGPYLIEKRADSLKKAAFKGNSKVIEVSEEEALKMARKLKQEFGAYERHPGKDGKVTFIITPEDDQEVPEGFEDLTFAKCDEIAKDSVMAKGKRSSVVGPKREEEVEEEEIEVKEEEEIKEEETVEISVRRMEIKFDEKIKDVQDLQKLVQEKVEIEKHPETPEQLQKAIQLMEQATETICEENGLSFKNLYKSVKYILMDEVSWYWLKIKEKSVQKQLTLA